MYAKVSLIPGMIDRIDNFSLLYADADMLNRVGKICAKILESIGRTVEKPNAVLPLSTADRFMCAFESSPTNGRRSLCGYSKRERHIRCAYMIGLLEQLVSGADRKEYNERLQKCITKNDYECLYVRLLGTFEVIIAKLK